MSTTIIRKGTVGPNLEPAVEFAVPVSAVLLDDEADREAVAEMAAMLIKKAVRDYLAPAEQEATR